MAKQEKSTGTGEDQIDWETLKETFFNEDDWAISEFMEVHPYNKPLGEEALLEVLNLDDGVIKESLVRIYKINEEILEAIVDTKKQAVRNSCELAGIKMAESIEEQEQLLKEYIQKVLKEGADYQKVLNTIYEFFEESLGKTRINKIMNEAMMTNAEEKKEALKMYFNKILNKGFEEDKYQKVLDKACVSFESCCMGKLTIQKIWDEIVIANSEEKKRNDPVIQKSKEIVGGYDSC